MNSPIQESALLDQLFDAVYFVGRDGRIEYWNQAAEGLTGYKRDEVIGRKCSDSNLLRHVDHEGKPICGKRCPLSRCAANGQADEAEVFLHHQKGHMVPVRLRATPIRDATGEFVGVAEVFVDNTDNLIRKQEMESLREMAFVDTLTLIPNRRYLEARLKTQFSEYFRHKTPFGVFIADVDHFKQVNDTFGHDTGDEVLKMIARTLDHGTRDMDVVGRWGGEEFLGIIPNVDAMGLRIAVERIRNLIGTRAQEHPDGFRVTASFGATIVLPDDSGASIIARVDELLYESKHNGRNQTTLR